MNDGEKRSTIRTDTDLALIYAGCRKPFPEDLKVRIKELDEKLNREVTPAFWWTVCDLSFEPEGVRLKNTGIVLEGELAKKQLAGADKAVFMAGTLSLTFDRLLSRMQLMNPADALLFDALGSSAIESVIDLAEADVEKAMPEYECGQRFSCGYGDLPLSLQKDLFESFDISRRCGIYLTDSLMMNPTKSITAFAPLKKREASCHIDAVDPANRKNDSKSKKNCGGCDMNRTCAYSEGSE